MAPFFSDQLKAFGDVNRPCRVQDVVGPQRHVLIARLLRKLDAGAHQLLANAKPARGGQHKHHAQLGHRIVLLHHKGAAQSLLTLAIGA